MIRKRKECQPGQRFNKLVVIRQVEPTGKQNPRINYYELQCDCGNKAVADALSLHNGRRVGCGCTKGNWWNKKTTAGWTSYHYYSVLKRTAAKKKREFQLTLEQYNEVVAKPCGYCGTTENVSVDRIDNDVGYVVGNVTPCCKVCNRMKHAMSHDEFVKHLRRIADTVSGMR